MTENQMTVVRLTFGGRTIHVTGGGRSATGSFLESGAPITPHADPHLILLLTVAALVNNATVESARQGLELHGDPSEAALLVAAVKAGVEPVALAQTWPRRREIPFDPATRMMATVHVMPSGGSVLLVKGAPGIVLERSRWRYTVFGDQPLADRDRQGLLEENRAMAREGLRVLAVAWRPVDGREDELLERLTFLGLIGLEDPLRPGVREAIAECGAAGIRTIMLTGDQQLTAESIGRALGLAPDSIRSRVSPEGKLALIESLQAEGQVVAMTGDGVNDAPALARADIGVAMGRHGTDVARESADLVLTDDNFATLTHAVEEGRVIYANLRKVIHFLFSCNLSEILTIFIAILAGFPAPLLPLQILWVNLVTDILPAGALIAAGVLSAYLWVVWQAGSGPRASTMAFMAVVLIHPFQAMNCRSERLGWWRLPSNPWIWVALLALVSLQWLSVAAPTLSRLLSTAPLAMTDWAVLAAGVLWPVVLMELVKGIRSRRLGQSCPTREYPEVPALGETRRNH